MAEDLVARLRAWNGNSFGPYRSPVPDLLEAADEIERLRDENEALRHSILHPVAVVVHPDEVRSDSHD